MPSQDWTIAEQDQFIAEALERDEPRLRSFIRKRVLDSGDAEDILQDVFYELIEAYRLMKPVEQVTAWLFRVARNRITDRFRRQKPVSLSDSCWRRRRIVVAGRSAAFGGCRSRGSLCQKPAARCAGRGPGRAARKSA